MLKQFFFKKKSTTITFKYFFYHRVAMEGNKDYGVGNSVDPTQIKRENLTIPILIMKQLDRCSFLLTLGITQKDGPTFLSEQRIAAGVLRGLRDIESYLFPFLTDAYKERATQIKQQIKYKPIGPDYFELLADWKDVLVLNLGEINLLPEREIELVY